MPIQHSHFDIVFAGWGASTCLLLKEMEKHGLLSNNRVAIIDPSTKKENDKTFCFWAQKEDDILLDHEDLISHHWTHIQINNNQKTPITPLQYYHINSLDLYDATRAIVDKFNIEMVAGKVEKIVKQEAYQISTETQQITSDWIFDSRPPDFSTIKNNPYYISQSFYGLKVELTSSQFDHEVYHMMDFRVTQQKSTQFIYILPYDHHTGLVELTRFGKLLIQKEEAKKILNKYIHEQYGEYTILDDEQGVIPMSSLLPKKSKKDKWVNIGTRGGSVKPSTGYAFKNMHKHAKQICANGKLNNVSFRANPRFLFYDQLLLIILTLWPLKGKPIFERLFNVRSPNFVLKFLDEKSSFGEDLSMFTQLQIGSFLKATAVWLFWKMKWVLPLLFMCLYAFLGQDQFTVNQGFFSSFDVYVLVSGLLLVGIPHGALDHLTEGLFAEKKVTFKFIFSYLGLMLPIFLVWYIFPTAGLLIFLIYSAWHFGQTDVKNWGFSNSLLAFGWGVSLLAFLFGTHFNEFNYILSIIGVQPLPMVNDIDVWSYALLLWPTVVALVYKKWNWLSLIVFLLFAQNVGLLVAFGLYFIFHHSLTGWNNLKTNLKWSHLKMYTQALPFNLGAIFLYWLLFVKLENTLEVNAALFLVFLSCVSFPHVICMSKFYQKNNLGIT